MADFNRLPELQTCCTVTGSVAVWTWTQSSKREPWKKDSRFTFPPLSRSEARRSERPTDRLTDILVMVHSENIDKSYYSTVLWALLFLRGGLPATAPHATARSRSWFIRKVFTFTPTVGSFMIRMSLAALVHGRQWFILEFYYGVQFTYCTPYWFLFRNVSPKPNVQYWTISQCCYRYMVKLRGMSSSSIILYCDGWIPSVSFRCPVEMMHQCWRS